MPEALAVDFTAVDEHHVRDCFGCIYTASTHGEPVVLGAVAGSFTDMRDFAVTLARSPEDFDAARFTRDLLGPNYPLMM
jgi:hydroxyethylthiazole kinase-like sugar kinase family protein